MIHIKESKTADTRTCDFSKVTREKLIKSSVQHMDDVARAISFFQGMLIDATDNHDTDKITDINSFHADFVTGFKQTTWWDNHKKLSRHHLLEAVGVPEDVNLIDVLEMISDCVMAGMARSGKIYPLNISPDVLMRAFNNTADLLQSQVIVEKNET